MSAVGAAVSAPAGIICRQACTRRELADHHAIRDQVFVREQGIFAGSDLDVHDNIASIRLVGYLDGVAAGTVRLFELDQETGLWQGDRLAVLAPFRTSGLGAPLVRCAVATAAALGGRQMVAHIQVANVRFFIRLGWTKVGEPETYVGLPHQQMLITLPPAEEGAATARALGQGSSRLPEA